MLARIDQYPQLRADDDSRRVADIVNRMYAQLAQATNALVTAESKIRELEQRLSRLESSGGPTFG